MVAALQFTNFKQAGNMYAQEKYMCQTENFIQILFFSMNTDGKVSAEQYFTLCIYLSSFIYLWYGAVRQQPSWHMGWTMDKYEYKRASRRVAQPHIAESISAVNFFQNVEFNTTCVTYCNSSGRRVGPHGVCHGHAHFPISPHGKTF